MKYIRIYYEAERTLKNRTTTENTIKLSLFTMRSFIFVKMLKQHLHMQCSNACLLSREFKVTTTATATGTSLNKRFNEQNNSCARAL